MELIRKLFAMYLLVVCTHLVVAEFLDSKQYKRITQPCTVNGKKTYGVNTSPCGDNPYCPYPDQVMEEHSFGFKDWCCCSPSSPHFDNKLTKITTRCIPGQARQRCEDFPYCENSDDTLERRADVCCCSGKVYINMGLAFGFGSGNGDLNVIGNDVPSWLKIVK